MRGSRIGGGSPGEAAEHFILVLTQLLTCCGTFPSLSCEFFTCEVKAGAGVSDEAGGEDILCSVTS